MKLGQPAPLGFLSCPGISESFLQGRCHPTNKCQSTERNTVALSFILPSSTTGLLMAGSLLPLQSQ